uniref:NADH-ubiquinone oxidoreductase chain 1 n=1 Tax=Salix viminalis TaxID=40686 RepID=A0A6N2LBF8_SALVM
MAFVQRRKGPDVVGSFGLLQPIADGLKLILKEPISPSSANLSLFRIAPVATFMLSLVARAVVPFDYGMIGQDVSRYPASKLPEYEWKNVKKLKLHEAYQKE